MYYYGTIENGAITSYTDFFTDEDQAKQWYNKVGEGIQKRLGRKLFLNEALEQDKVNKLYVHWHKSYDRLARY